MSETQYHDFKRSRASVEATEWATELKAKASAEFYNASVDAMTFGHVRIIQSGESAFSVVAERDRSVWLGMFPERRLADAFVREMGLFCHHRPEHRWGNAEVGGRTAAGPDILIHVIDNIYCILTPDLVAWNLKGVTALHFKPKD